MGADFLNKAVECKLKSKGALAQLFKGNEFNMTITLSAKAGSCT